MNVVNGDAYNVSFIFSLKWHASARSKGRKEGAEEVCCTYVDKVSSLYHEVFDHPAQEQNWINKIISITLKFVRELHSCETRDRCSDMIVCT